VEADYSIIHPKTLGQEWDISFSIAPTIQNPFRHK